MASAKLKYVLCECIINCIMYCQYPVAAPSSSITHGIILFKWLIYMYLFHSSTVTVSLNPTIPSINSCLVVGFYLSSNEFFHLMPEILYWVQIRQLCWSFPLIDSLFSKELLSIMRSVLRIIVLHEPIMGGILCFNEGDQCFVQDFCKQEPIHCPLEHADASPAFLANSSPNVNLYWMFSPVWNNVVMCAQYIHSVMCNCMSSSLPWFDFGACPIFRQQKRRWFSSWIVDSSVQMTSANSSSL